MCACAASVATFLCWAVMAGLLCSAVSVILFRACDHAHECSVELYEPPVPAASCWVTTAVVSKLV
jgi:hypothetical protein